MTQCVYNNDTNKWSIEMTAYNDTNCNQAIISKHKFPCLQEKNCQCGKGICPQNETIVIKQSDDIHLNQEMKDECIDKFRNIVFIKDQCISSQFIQYVMESASIDSDDESVEEEHDNHDWSSINGVMLKCDQKLQQLSFYEYQDDECNHDPLFSEPEILIDVLDFPCVEILC